MKLGKIDIFAGIDMSEEAVRNRKIENFKLSKENPENMSYWLPKIQESEISHSSNLKIPKTKIVQLGIEDWNWLRSDKYTTEDTLKFNQTLLNEIREFLNEEKILFMKTGVFSNKFNFNDTIIEDENTIGEKLLNIYYTSMIFGADNTSEAVFREMVPDKENRLKIYNSMPLHTEYRVFYNFDTDEVIGISNYWHPQLMEASLKNDDLLNYQTEKHKIIFDFNTYKYDVCQEVKKFMLTVKIEGRWSVDIMKNGENFWLIDMARMERSALIDQMEIF